MKRAGRGAAACRGFVRPGRLPRNRPAGAPAAESSGRGACPGIRPAGAPVGSVQPPLSTWIGLTRFESLTLSPG